VIDLLAVVSSGTKWSLAVALVVAIGGSVLLVLMRARAFAAVLNEYVEQEEALAHVANLEVRAVGGVLSLQTPMGSSAHAASRSGAGEILRIIKRLVSVRTHDNVPEPIEGEEVTVPQGRVEAQGSQPS
jgi:hypothetical protein